MLLAEQTSLHAGPSAFQRMSSLDYLVTSLLSRRCGVLCQLARLQEFEVHVAEQTSLHARPLVYCCLPCLLARLQIGYLSLADHDGCQCLVCRESW